MSDWADAWAKVESRGWAIVQHEGIATPCWEFAGGRFNHGYGRVWHGGTHLLAHRVSLAYHAGIPDGLDALHSCDNPPCVNPEHLSAGTHLRNMQEMAQRGRAGGRRGARNPSAKLTQAQADQIRAMYAHGQGTQRDLAAKFRVSQTTVWHILRGLIYVR